MKKYLIGLGVIICLAITIDKAHEFFFTNKPVASVGECLAIEEPKLGHLEVKILKNDNDAGVSDVVVKAEVMPGVKVLIPAEAKYSELRELKAKKVECTI